MNLISNPAFWSRFQFGFTLTYHYLFPQLTMGLAWIIVYFKWRALRSGDEEYNKAARFWARIFGLNFDGCRYRYTHGISVSERTGQALLGLRVV